MWADSDVPMAIVVMSEAVYGLNSVNSLGFHPGVAGPYTAAMENADPTKSDAPVTASQDVDLETLVAAMAQRDEHALAAFYDATAARAYALILRITQVAPMAEEVLSDVYMQVWQQAQRFDPTRGKALAWLFMLCRSRALDQLRRRDPAETFADPECEGLESATGAGPLDLLLAVDRSSAIHAALRQLGEVERQLLALAFFRGLTHQEIAMQTAMPLGSVKTVLRKAMLKLKELLSQHASETEGLA